MAYARISVTVPKAVLKALDRRAKELDRPRSWVVSEALSRYLASERPTPRPRRAQVAEPVAAGYGVTEVADARRRHLVEGLRLSADERLRRVEELRSLARPRPSRGPRRQIIAFDRYEDFYEWKKIQRAQG